MYYSFYIFVSQGPASVNQLIFHARELDHPGRTIGSSSGWSHRLVFSLLDRSIGWTTRFMDFLANQLVRLFGTHFYLALTLPLASWLGYLVIDSSPTSWLDCSSLHRQLRWESPLGVWILCASVTS
jgi:hypothetical protein